LLRERLLGHGNQGRNCGADEIAPPQGQAAATHAPLPIHGLPLYGHDVPRL
jgi:hypothetical protein